MKITFMLLLAIGLSTSDKLDRTYLPPPGSQFSGGSVEDLKTPLDLPKQYYTTGAPHTVFFQGQSGNKDISINGSNSDSDRISTPYQYSNTVTPSPQIPQRIYNIPTTTTSYAFTQTTTYSPIEDTENSRNSLVTGGQTIGNYNPQSNGIGELNSVAPALNQFKNNQQYFPIQQQNKFGDQSNPNRNPNAFVPSQTNYNQFKTDGNPIIGQITSKVPTEKQGINSYGQKFDGLPGQGIQFDQNMKLSTPAPDRTYVNSQSPNSKDAYRKLMTQPNQFVKDGTYSTPFNSQTYSGTPSLPSTTAPVINGVPSLALTPNQFPGSISPNSPVFAGVPNGNKQVSFPSQPDSSNLIKNYDNNVKVPITSQNYGINTDSPQFLAPASTQSTDIDFETSAPNRFSNISPFAKPEYSGNTDLKTYIRPERPQAQADRNAYILNYENILTPEGFSYSFDTSNGIHADESGSAINGVRAQGSYSYIGDDGKEYRVTYTADENGFLPRGDHLPTPPPISEAILRVIEQAKKNKEAGTLEDGSYDDNKYGYKKYQGPIEFNRPKGIKNSQFNKTSYISQNNQSLKPEVTYTTEVNKEDTIDYIEEDVNASDDNETPEQYSGLPIRKPGTNGVNKQKGFFVKDDVTADDQKPTIGINRRPGSRKPNRNQGPTNSSQNVGILDRLNTGTENINKQTVPSNNAYRNQNPHNVYLQVKTPNTPQISYNTPEIGSQIPFNQQIADTPSENGLDDISRSVQSTYQKGNEFTMSQENKQKQYYPNGISNGEQLQVITPNAPHISYNTPVIGSNIPFNQQTVDAPLGNGLVDISAPIQSTYQKSNEFTTSQENKQKSYYPNRNSNRKQFTTIDQNTGYEYSIPNKTYELTQNNRTPYNLPEATKTLTDGKKGTVQPFVTPILNSSEESEENLSDSYENPNNSNNRVGFPQSPILINPQGTRQNLIGSQTSQNEYLPNENKDNQYNLQGQKTFNTGFTVGSVPTPSLVPEYFSTYRPSTVSFDGQTTFIPTSYSPIKQSNAEYEKRFPTTTYRPNYVINKDVQTGNFNMPTGNIFEQTEPGQVNLNLNNGNLRPAVNDLPANERNIQTQNKPISADNFGASVQKQPNQPFFNTKGSSAENYGKPIFNLEQNNPEYFESGSIVRPEADMNEISKPADQRKQYQGSQNIESHNPAVGRIPIAEDKYGRPLIPSGILKQENKDSEYTIAPKTQATIDNIAPYQQEISGQGTIVGEYFSGPIQKQKFDPQTGYYYK